MTMSMFICDLIHPLVLPLIGAADRQRGYNIQDNLLDFPTVSILIYTRHCGIYIKDSLEWHYEKRLGTLGIDALIR